MTHRFDRDHKHRTMCGLKVPEASIRGQWPVDCRLYMRAGAARGYYPESPQEEFGL